MARTAEGARLTVLHRQGQLRLRAATLRDLTRLWPLWTLSDTASFGRFTSATTTLVRARHRDSAGLAAGYYQGFRLAENVGGIATPKLAVPPPPAKITRALQATGLAGTIRALRAGFSPQAAMQNGFVRASGAVGRLVLGGANSTILGSTAGDRQARGWARVTGGKPCAFCAEVAGRGPVFSEAGADFQAHDHDACMSEPHYDGSEWPGRAREFRAMWDRETRGLSGADATNAFRRALDNN